MRNIHKMVRPAAFLAALWLVQGQARAQLAAGDPATNFVLANWVTGLNSATDIAWLRDGRAIVIRKTGQVVLLDWQGNVLNSQAARLTVDSTSEKGLLGVVVDGDDNIYLYASLGNDSNNKHKILKARAGANDVVVDLDNPLMSQGLEGPANHDGGGLIIHKGQLYISVGDTGDNNTPPTNRYGACLNRANGKILRINLDGSIPADNPLVGVAMATGCSSRSSGNYSLLPPDPRIYAWGLRNPWRFWIDPMTDLLWIGDVGEETEEEVSVGGKGINHGWPFEEGKQKYNGLGGLATCAEMTPSKPCTAPQDSYGHGGSPAAVVGGMVPRAGCGWGDYEDRYFFGDYNRGDVWTLDLEPDRSGAVPGSRKEFASLGANSIVSFRTGPDGAMYLVSNSQGSVRRLAPKNLAPACQAVAIDAGVPPADAGVDGPHRDAAGDAGGRRDAPADAPSGSGGAGGAGGSGGGGGSGGAGGAGGSGTGKPASADSGGCSCDLGGGHRGADGPLALLLAAAAVLLGARTRRGRAPRHRR